MPVHDPDNYTAIWESPAAAEKESGGSSETDPSVPDGEHRTRIVGWDCFQSQKGDVWMKWTFAIMGGLYDGRCLVRLVAPLGRREDDEDWRAKQASFARTDLKTVLGKVPPFNELMDPDTLKTGPAVMEIVGAVVTVAVQRKKTPQGERINVYLNDLISSADVAGLVDTPDNGNGSPLPPVDGPRTLPDEPSRGSGMIDPEGDIPY